MATPALPILATIRRPRRLAAFSPLLILLWRQHVLLFDGSPYDPREVAFIRQLTGRTPAPL